MFGMWTPGLPNGNRESAGMVSTKHEKLPNFKDRIFKKRTTSKRLHRSVVYSEFAIQTTSRFYLPIIFYNRLIGGLFFDESNNKN